MITKKTNLIPFQPKKIIVYDSLIDPVNPKRDIMESNKVLKYYCTIDRYEKWTNFALCYYKKVKGRKH